MTKKERQTKLKSYILEHEFDTQNDLVDFLNQKGLNVTQATVSRDIKELGIVKVKNKDKYRYTLIEKNLENTNGFSGVVLEVITAQNLIVVKTSVGAASSVCIFIDNAQIKGVVGTVAGDDTIIIVTQSNEEAEKNSKRQK